MRWSSAHIPTLREAPQDAEVVSHQLMIRAGMIRKLSAGIYSFLPLGSRVLQKMENIIRDEMDLSGAQEVLLPFVQPRELWEEAGRWGIYGKELGRFKDRHENEYCLQPTSEEAITDLVRRDIRSYRQLPVNLYQIQTKFRDEIRPRFGIMRSREFIMKDAYSFDLDEAGALKSYEAMRKVYRRIFTRTGLDFKPVDADTGAIGGSRSEEFTVLAQSGEDEIVSCSKCHYGANQEKAIGVVPLPHDGAMDQKLEKFPTPGLKTISDLAKSLSLKSSDLMKTMVATDSEQHRIVVLLRGDHDLHDVKLQRAVNQRKGWSGIRLATDEELRLWNLPKGSLGPAFFEKADLILVDSALNEKSAYISGANEEGYHFKNLILSRDISSYEKDTLRRIDSGEVCTLCGDALKILRGIEVGHVFYLGKKYSRAMKLEVTLESGKSETVEMGCYGIGVGRTVAACIEQNHDKDGIVWPLALAPYEVGISSLTEGPAQEMAKRLYDELRAEGVSVLWDDRVASPGVKLKDMDLIGIPYQIVIGDKSLARQVVEWKVRRGGQRQDISVTEIKNFTLGTIRENYRIIRESVEAIV